MKHPLSRCAPSPALAARGGEGNAPSAAGRPLRGGTGIGRASFNGCGWCAAQWATEMLGIHATSWRTTLQSVLPRSLRMQLLVFLLAAIVLAGAVQGALAYRGALAEADALFDYHMQQTALALRSGLPVDAQGVGTAPAPEDENTELIVQVWTNEGLRIFESAVGANLPQRRWTAAVCAGRGSARP